MSNKLLLKKKLDDLVNLMMTDGVQPSDLANNIFLQSYVQIIYKKINGKVIGEMHFKEEENEEYQTIVLRYFYGNDRKVYCIEEEIKGSVKILWDRDFKQMQIINQIVDIMQKYYDSAQIEKFISTLPSSISKHIKNKIREIAS